MLTPCLVVFPAGYLMNNLQSRVPALCGKHKHCSNSFFISMSSHTIIPKDQLDQENQHQNIFLNDSAKSVSSVPAKRLLSRGPPLPDKRTRVPLSGKNQNLQASLQRSKSFIPQNAQASRPTLSGTTLGFVPVLPHKPTLAKSNSTLGFFSHTGSAANKPGPVITRDTNPHKNEVFPALDAHRVKELVPRFTTDNIKKHAFSKRPPLKQRLQDTFSANSALLHSSNLPKTPASRDPSKKAAQLIEELADDEESVEHRPQTTMLPLTTEIAGYSPLRPADLKLLKTGHRPYADYKTEVYDLSFEDTSDEDEQQNLSLQKQLETEGPIGLTLKDLEDLLEF